MTETPFELRVGDLPPLADRPAGETAPPPPPPTDAGAAAIAPNAWTDDDLAKLTDIVKMPYEFVAVAPGQEWWALTDREARLIALPLSGLIPVGWVRRGEGSPIWSAISLAGALLIVNRPRIARLRTEVAARAEGGSATTEGRPGGGGGSGDRVDRSDVNGETGGAAPAASRRFEPVTLARS